MKINISLKFQQNAFKNVFDRHIHASVTVLFPVFHGNVTVPNAIVNADKRRQRSCNIQFLESCRIESNMHK